VQCVSVCVVDAVNTARCRGFCPSFAEAAGDAAAVLLFSMAAFADIRLILLIFRLNLSEWIHLPKPALGQASMNK
jgi:hypothetical protein